MTGTGSAPTELAAIFGEHRNLLFTVAYELTGSAADAEDVVQDTWLRWADVDVTAVREPRAYLSRIATRQALNRLRSLSRRRESYVGPWLPEPLLTTPDVADDVALADSLSTAMLLVLETLRPVERAVFVLHEVFGFEYDEIADAVDRSVVAVRQISSRARSHVAARRPRAQVGPRQRRQVFDRFVEAASSGDVQALMDVLAPDVVLISDGGGAKQAALRPIRGRDKVVRFLEAVGGSGVGSVDVAYVNDALALRVFDGEGLDSIVTFQFQDGLVSAIYLVRNPDKLSRIENPLALRR